MEDATNDIAGRLLVVVDGLASQRDAQSGFRGSPDIEQLQFVAAPFTQPEGQDVFPADLEGNELNGTSVLAAS